jgi:hypothetical protein
MHKNIKTICILFSAILIFSSFSLAKDFNSIKIHKSFTVSDSTQREITGEIESKKGKTVKVRISDPTSIPDVGTTGTLSKYFEEEILGMNTHGYIDIADVEVKSTNENIVTFTILKELSNIKINGKKENLFKEGVIVKFTW